MAIPADNHPLKVWDGEQWIRIRPPLETDQAITEILERLYRLENNIDPPDES